MMKILITGANGYLGQFLVPRVLAVGHEVTTLTRRQYSHANTHNEMMAEYDSKILSSILVGQDVVVHLAAFAHQAKRASPEIEARYHQINVVNTMRLAVAAKMAGVKRFIFISSVKVNGERTTVRPFTANDVPAPEDAYGRSKWAAEQELTHLFEDGVTELVIVRPPLIWGGVPKGNLALLKRLLELGIPLPFKSINNKRDLVSRENLCDLIVCVLSHPSAAWRTFLVSDGIARSTADISALVAQQVGIRPRLFSVGSHVLVWVSRLPFLQNTFDKLIGNLEVDISDTVKTLDWKPQQQ